MTPGLLVIPTLYILGSLYLYNWTTRMARPSPGVRRAVLLGLMSLVILFPVSKVWGRHDLNILNQFMTLVSSVWMGMTFLLITLAGTSDILHFLHRRVVPNSPLSWSRSVSYGRTLASGILLGAVFLGGYSLWEAKHIGVTEIEIPMRRLPPELDGLSIVQLSDVHYGILHENGRLSDIVNRVNGLRPDLVVFTGDLVDEAVSHMEEMAIPLSNIKSRLGVMAIMGNHEFFAGAGRAEAIMRKAGIQVLRNEMKELPGGLQVLGIDDPTGYRRMSLPKPDFDGLIQGLDPKKPSILLYHQPVEFEKGAAAGVGIQLSGHIHGPQLLPMAPLARIFFPHFRGLYNLAESYLLVSRGVGTGGPPMRLGSPPEIIRIKLRSANTKG